MPSAAIPFWEVIKAPLQESAARVGIAISPAVVTGKADRAGFESVFDAMEKDQVDGLSVGETSENFANRELIVGLQPDTACPRYIRIVNTSISVGCCLTALISVTRTVAWPT
jgi:hypothetical protein